jgi:polyisoprenoid-binding protein YceI
LNSIKSLPLFLIFLSWSTLTLAQTQWEIQPIYSIQFDGTGAEGTFRGLTGIIQFDPAIPENASFDVELDPSTIDTGNNKKDEHARSDSWFDVVQYPRITFKSSSIIKSENGYVLSGLLSLHGVKKEISIPFNFETVSENIGIFTGSFTLDREDYSIKGPLLGLFVGDEFEVLIEVPVKKK